jgi:hypothetical protein
MDSTNITELIKVANYRTFKRSIKNWGIADICFGIPTTIWGVIGGAIFDPLNLLMVPMGLFMIGLGIFVRINSRVDGLLLSGIMFLVLGSWGIFTIILNIITYFTSPRVVSSLIIGLSAGAIFWAPIYIDTGIKAVKAFKRYLINPVIKPTDDAIKYIDKLAISINGASFRQNALSLIIIRKSDIIMFRIETIGWLGKLFPSYALLASDSEDFEIVRPPDMEITLNGKKKTSFGVTCLGATLVINKKTHNGTIDPLSLERFLAWKNPFSGK